MARRLVLAAGAAAYIAWLLWPAAYWDPFTSLVIVTVPSLVTFIMVLAVQVFVDAERLLVQHVRQRRQHQ